jgi:hypothetical protein
LLAVSVASASLKSVKNSSLRLFLVGCAALVALAGCTSRVPTSWDSEYAKPNFMETCDDGSSKPFCTCVWDEMVKTVDWDVYTKFDKDQAAVEEGEKVPALPAGIEKAVDKCSKKFASGETDSTTTTARDSEKTSDSEKKAE